MTPEGACGPSTGRHNHRRHWQLRRIKKAYINGVPWEVKWPKEIYGGTCYGLCEIDTKTINYERGLQGQQLLVYSIHEMLHAEFPKASEAVVTQAAEDIADVLWRMGFRDKDQE